MALALLTGAAYGAYIENTASMTYLDPYTGAEVTVYSNTVRTEIIPHTVDVTATAVPIP
ncbi:MAG TPA: hypothetical protein VNA25_11845 [Phycisphaerae bacterium]|nr:hypothetical protein [Phycisphaerae bacterium]